jgi:saccharopine dehydrogenase-like NADP-dependent oxidoreductase
MGAQYHVMILGNGRIARAVSFYFKKNTSVGKVSFLERDSQAEGADLLIGALPGGLGEKGLALALRYKKNLIDISDIDPPFYLKHKKRIANSGITVIPGCGFCPGIVNAILGKETASLSGIRDIEVSAGSLSRKPLYFPFLWCFEDLSLEHQLFSYQTVNGKKVKFGPFEGFRKEKFFGIDAESYLSASGFENILDKVGARNITCRVIRPAGFRQFFGFLKNGGFLSKDNLFTTKSIVEANVKDNITLATVTLAARGQKVRWMLKSSSRAGEGLNSMQKITASVPAAVGFLLFKSDVLPKGLVFMEDAGRDERFFAGLIRAVRREKITVSRAISTER